LVIRYYWITQSEIFMTARTRQLIASAVFGAAIVTAFIVVVPKVVATQFQPKTPVAAPVVAESPDPSATDGSVDMRQWQQTAMPKASPFTKGQSSTRKPTKPTRQ